MDKNWDSILKYIQHSEKYTRNKSAQSFSGKIFHDIHENIFSAIRCLDLILETGDSPLALDVLNRLTEISTQTTSVFLISQSSSEIECWNIFKTIKKGFLEILNIEDAKLTSLRFDSANGTLLRTCELNLENAKMLATYLKDENYIKLWTHQR